MLGQRTPSRDETSPREVNRRIPVEEAGRLEDAVDQAGGLAGLGVEDLIHPDAGALFERRQDGPGESGVHGTVDRDLPTVGTNFTDGICVCFAP